MPTYQELHDQAKKQPQNSFDAQEVFTYIKAIPFMATFCPQVTNLRQKMAGRDNTGRVVQFTEADQYAIREGIKKLFENISK